MSSRNICPICGSENPEGSVVCQVCKVNLQNLPDDVYTPEPVPEDILPAAETDQTAAPNDELDPDSPVPVWLQKRFQQKDKTERTNFDFDSYTDALFGGSTTGKSSGQKSTSRPRKPRKSEPVYQPTLGNLVESPLVETDEDPAVMEPKNFPTLVDFKTIRPVKKWDDPDQQKKTDAVKRQSDKAFQTTAVQMPLWWQQDAPLVEDDTPADAGKSADDEKDEFFSSVSPTKVLDPESVADDEQLYSGNAVQQGAPAEAPGDDYKPESGSLLSDLMNEINSNSVTPAPQENRVQENGTVFYTGNENAPAEEESSASDTVIPAGDSISSAEALDQILRGMGYQTEDEAGSADPVKPEPEAALQSQTAEPAVTPEPAPAVENTDNVPDVPAADDDYFDTKIPEKEDLLDELDIPWDLFGSQDMTLPQSGEDPALKTFSRSGIPAEQESTTYQQRMMSSILEKIIYAENFVPAVEKSNPRRVSMLARLFWFLAAVGGAVLILMTGIADRIALPALSDTAEAGAFYAAAEAAAGEPLVVLDYTPAYSAELDGAAEKLLTTLEESAEKVRLCSLNGAAMPKVHEILAAHGDKLEFAGWWPAGIISLRSHLASGSVPEDVWLITADSVSIRSWAEQLSVTGGEHRLHVLSSGQTEPLLKPYLEAGLVSSALSRDTDLVRYAGEAENSARARCAVLYLAVLLPVAWLGGAAAKFLKSDPNYGRKNTRKQGTNQTEPEKGAADDGRL